MATDLVKDATNRAYLWWPPAKRLLLSSRPSERAGERATDLESLGPATVGDVI